MKERGREGGRGGEREREGEREGGREREREGGRERGREGGREKERKREREREREWLLHTFHSKHSLISLPLIHRFSLPSNHKKWSRLRLVIKSYLIDVLQVRCVWVCGVSVWEGRERKFLCVCVCV